MDQIRGPEFDWLLSGQDRLPTPLSQACCDEALPSLKNGPSPWSLSPLAASFELAHVRWIVALFLDSVSSGSYARCSRSVSRYHSLVGGTLRCVLRELVPVCRFWLSQLPFFFTPCSQGRYL